MADNTASQAPRRPRYHRGYTLAFWFVYGVLCVSGLHLVYPAMFADWPVLADIGLYVATAAVTSAAFTFLRYRVRCNPNHGRWLMILWAAAFAIGYAFWLLWLGMGLIALACVAGYLLDQHLPFPEPGL